MLNVSRDHRKFRSPQFVVSMKCIVLLADVDMFMAISRAILGAIYGFIHLHHISTSLIVGVNFNCADFESRSSMYVSYDRLQQES